MAKESDPFNLVVWDTIWFYITWLLRSLSRILVALKRSMHLSRPKNILWGLMCAYQSCHQWSWNLSCQETNVPYIRRHNWSVFPIHFICDVLLAELVQTYFTSVSSLAFSLIVRSTVVEVLSSKRLRASLLVTYRRTCVCIMFTVFLQHITVYNFYCVGHTHVYCMYGGVN